MIDWRAMIFALYVLAAIACLSMSICYVWEHQYAPAFQGALGFMFFVHMASNHTGDE